MQGMPLLGSCQPLNKGGTHQAGCGLAVQACEGHDQLYCLPLVDRHSLDGLPGAQLERVAGSRGLKDSTGSTLVARGFLAALAGLGDVTCYTAEGEHVVDTDHAASVSGAAAHEPRDVVLEEHLCYVGRMSLKRLRWYQGSLKKVSGLGNSGAVQQACKAAEQGCRGGPGFSLVCCYHVEFFCMDVGFVWVRWLPSMPLLDVLQSPLCRVSSNGA